MESSGAEPGAFIAPRVLAPYSERCPATRGGPAAARSGKSAAILAPIRRRVLRFATYFAARHHPLELPGGHLRRAARRAAQELPERLRKQERHRTARL